MECLNQETLLLVASEPTKTEQKSKQEQISEEVFSSRTRTGTPKIEEQSVWDDEEEDEKGYLLNLKFSSEMLRNGSDPLFLINELKEIGGFNTFPSP